MEHAKWTSLVAAVLPTWTETFLIPFHVHVNWEALQNLPNKIHSNDKSNVIIFQELKNQFMSLLVAVQQKRKDFQADKKKNLNQRKPGMAGKPNNGAEPGTVSRLWSVTLLGTYGNKNILGRYDMHKMGNFDNFEKE